MGAVLVPLLVGPRAGRRPPARLVALRRVHRRVPGEDPAARAPAGAAPRSRRGARRAAARAARVHALVVRVVVVARLPATAISTRLGAAARRPGRARPGARAGRRPGWDAATGTADEPRRASSPRTLSRRASSSTAGGAADRGRRRVAGRVRRWPTPAASCSRRRRTSRVPPRSFRTCTSRSSPRTSSCAGLEELFAAVGDDLPSSLAIVTGPSRSADIEQKLTVGVHGPGEVHVVIQGR